MVRRSKADQTILLKTQVLYYAILFYFLSKNIKFMSMVAYFGSIFFEIGFIFYEERYKDHRNDNLPRVSLFTRNIFGILFFVIDFEVLQNNGYKLLFKEHNYDMRILEKHITRICVWNLESLIYISCTNENIDGIRSYENSNIDVSSCFFSRTSRYFGSGSIVFVQIMGYSMSIIDSVFANCTATKNGGAIYFISSETKFRMVCAYGCSSSNGHFCYIQATNSNQFDYLSIKLCSTQGNGVGSIYIQSGNLELIHSNSSNNIAFKSSCINVDYSEEFAISYCTFSDNLAANKCIGLSSTWGLIEYCNIIQNNSTSLPGIISLDQGSIDIQYCMFYKNGDVLFGVLSGVLCVSHSFISHSDSISSFMEISTNNVSFIMIETYNLKHHGTYLCFAADQKIHDGLVTNTIDLTLELSRTIFSTIKKSIPVESSDMTLEYSDTIIPTIKMSIPVESSDKTLEYSDTTFPTTKKSIPVESSNTTSYTYVVNGESTLLNNFSIKPTPTKNSIEESLLMANIYYVMVSGSFVIIMVSFLLYKAKNNASISDSSDTGSLYKSKV